MVLRKRSARVLGDKKMDVPEIEREIDDLSCHEGLESQAVRGGRAPPAVLARHLTTISRAEGEVEEHAQLVGAVRATAVQQPTVVPACRPRREALISVLGVSGPAATASSRVRSAASPRARCRFWSWRHGEGAGTRGAS